MNATAPQHLAAELLSATDIAKLLQLTPRGVRLRMERSGIPAQARDGIQAWPFAALPADYQQQLAFVRQRSGLWTFEDVLRQSVPRWEPARKFATLPEATQEKTLKVREVMLVYFDVLEREEVVHVAECAARRTWLALFGDATSAKTIQRWAKKIDARGTIEWAPLEAYADGKSVKHENATLLKRSERMALVKDFGALIREFKVRATMAGMNIAAAHRSLQEDWDNGIEVPGLGRKSEPRQAFPFKSAQLRKFAPSSAARKLGNRGKAAALRDALPHITRTYETLRACEQYVFDDTRLNVTAIDDLTGLPVEMKCYIAMDCASRAIVGYVIRKGNMLASDVDALTAQVLRTAGHAHPNAGYFTTLLYERGTVACSPAKRKYLEALLPGIIRIKSTSMDGGQNFAGDYVQAPSGHWMGKGMIESFNRTLGYFLLHLPGQRGSTWATMPAMVGYPQIVDGKMKPHAGSQVKEAYDLALAAIEKAYIESHGANETPRADESIKAAGIKLPLKRVSEFRQAFARSVGFYNSTRNHRREGFRQLAVDRANGGLEYLPESSNQRWTYLTRQAEQIGKAPQRLSPADTVLLLHKARRVTVRPNGVLIEEEGIKRRYWHQDSIACQEANLLTGSEREYIAVIPPEEKSEIYLLRNAPSSKFEDGPFQFLECLPLYEKPGVNDPVALGRAFEAKRQVVNRAAGELAEIHRERMKDVAQERETNASKFVGVITTRGGVHVTSDLSAVGKQMRSARAHITPPARPGNGRDNGTNQSAQDDFVNSLKGETA